VSLVVKPRVQLKDRVVIAIMVLLGGLTLTQLGQASPEASGTLLDVPSGVSAPLDNGASFSCAIRTYGWLACWGSNAYGVGNVPTGTFRQVSAGGQHACAIQSKGTVACWGDNSYGQALPPAGIFVQLSAGGLYTCGLRVGGNMACWGNNAYGVAVPRAGSFTQISAGKLHACAIRGGTGGFSIPAGSVVCWGDDSVGQTDVYDSDGGPAADGTTFTQVSAGDYHSCGIKTDGLVLCWGDQTFGQTQPYASFGGPVPDGTTFTAISSGGYHTCGITTSGYLACWGDNTYGQASPPGGPGTVERLTAVSAGGSATCGVRHDGEVVCWGRFADGQALSGVPAGLRVKRAVIDAGYAREVTEGGRWDCGITPNAILLCFGYAALKGGMTFTQVSAGGNVGCAIRDDGTVFCGSGTDQLPDAFYVTHVYVSQHGPVPDGTTFTQVSVGDKHACGIETNGTVACWGRAWAAPFGTFTQISAGFDYTCGVRTDGTVACWGNNRRREAGPPPGD